MQNITVCAPNYNYTFNPETGFFARWGETFEDDPVMSPLGPEIADIEISTICHGLGKPCKFCYKSNNARGKNMNLETFKQVFSKLPNNLTQIAFGIGDIDSNPDMFSIFEHCRESGIVPNVTINGWKLTAEIVQRLASVCGAVAVSRYEPKDVCYDAVKMLADAGLEQVNIHMLTAEETYDDCLELLDDMENDIRLEKLNATVFLSLKQRGRGTSTNRLSLQKFSHLVNSALDRQLSIGFDSCSANKFLMAVRNRPEIELLQVFSEPCESGLFSAYINVEGKFFPCSFTEDGDGLDVINCEKFMKDVWFDEGLEWWREILLENNRNCPIYRT